MAKKSKYELGDMLRQSWFISLAFLSLSARFPASELAVSPLYSNQVASCTPACPCAGGQRGRGRGSRWGMVPSTHLPLRYFTCLLSCLCCNTWELGDFSEKWWLGLLTMVDQWCFLFSGVPQEFWIFFFFFPAFGLWQNAQQGQTSVQMAKICQIHWN